MGVFRREQQKKELNTASGRFTITTAADEPPAQEPCWFCGGDVAPGEGGSLSVEPFGAGEAVHGVCHVACVERARGSLDRERI